MRQNITASLLDRVKPKAKPYFIRSVSVIGFGIKVTPVGSIKYIAESKARGVNHRKTLGTYPMLTINEAEQEAIAFVRMIQTGRIKPREVSLQDLLSRYVQSVQLKPNTIKNYDEVIGFYLRDWLKIPVSDISKQMVEKRFIQIRDKGVNGGIPTYSQATKTMRILSALMNYARADELIESNPVEVLKFKRIDRSIRKRDHYLPAQKVRELLAISAQDDHPVTLAIHLMLYSGLRKNEALRLKWSDIEGIEGIQCLS